MSVFSSQKPFQATRQGELGEKSKGQQNQDEKSYGDWPTASNAIRLFALFDGIDESSLFLPKLIKWLRSFVDENVKVNQHQHLVMLTSRPGVVGLMHDLIGNHSFNLLVIEPLTDAQAAELATKTLTRSGEEQGIVDQICRLVTAPEYQAMKAVPIVLTLLVHVLRKYFV